MLFTKKSLAILGTVIAVTTAVQPVTNVFADTTEIPEAQVLQDSYTAIDVSSVVENVMPAIVSITTKTEIENPYAFWYGEGFNQQYSYEGSGSGIIIKQDEDKLLIVTNKHVVNGADQVSVCFSVDSENEDNLIVPAKVNGTDSSLDIAVVSVDIADIDKEILGELRTAVLGDSSEIKVGQAAIVIGNALGFGQTVTTGIVSALERPVTAENNLEIQEIQTDAAINMGCSGGALLNSNGEVIGITDAKAISDYAESMGYAIPVNSVKKTIERLSSNSGILSDEERGFLGVTVTNASSEAMKLYGIPEGAYVTEVGKGSAAEEAGMIKGDIIVSLDGETVNGADSLVEKLQFIKSGEKVSLVVKRADEGEYVEKELEAVLQKKEGSDDADAEDAPSKDDEEKEEKEPETSTEFQDEFWNNKDFWEEFEERQREIDEKYPSESSIKWNGMF